MTLSINSDKNKQSPCNTPVKWFMICVLIVLLSAVNVTFVVYTFISCEIVFMIFNGALANFNALIIQLFGIESMAFL